jgi:hypothetical protein
VKDYERKITVFNEFKILKLNEEREEERNKEMNLKGGKKI